MKKFFAIFPITILFILLSNYSDVFATVAFPEGTYIIIGGAGGAYRGYNSENPISYVLNGTTLTFSSSSIIYEYTFSSGADEIPSYEQILNGSLLSTSYSFTRYYVPAVNIYVVNGSFNGSGINSETYPNLPEPEPDPTWWDLVKDYLFGFGEEPLWDLIPDLWDLWFGFHLDGDDVEYGEPIEYIEPPSPTPFPTQIPYQTIINPSGEVTYKYIGPSGVPITATAPPPEPTYTIQITDYPQYDVSGVPVPPDEGLNDIIDSLDDTVSEYQEGLSVVQNSMSVLPLKWFFFFGIPAAIIIIAGIIKSLLGG